MLYSVATFRSASAMIREVHDRALRVVDVLNPCQMLWHRINTQRDGLDVALAKPASSFDVVPSSVVQTGVKSAGCERRRPNYHLPTHGSGSGQWLIPG